jgi:hypothetical protein
MIAAKSWLTHKPSMWIPTQNITGHSSDFATLWELAAMCSDGPAGQLYRDRLQARRSSHRVLRIPELLQGRLRILF